MVQIILDYETGIITLSHDFISHMVQIILKRNFRLSESVFCLYIPHGSDNTLQKVD